MQAVILAGGLGTRLKPLTQELPKPMIQVVDKPLMEYTVDLLKKHGVNEIFVTTMYLPQYISNYFGNGDKWDVSIKYFEETEPLGTAGGVKLAENELKDDFIVISGDALINVDLSKILKYHSTVGADVTIVLSKEAKPLEFGVVLTDSDGRVFSFNEKPLWENVVSNTVNTGIYVLKKSILEKIPTKTNFDFSNDLFPLLLKENYKIYGYITEDYWSDVGNTERYLDALKAVLDGKVTGEKYENVVSENVKISEDAKIIPPVFIGKDTIVSKNCAIGPYTVIGDNCIVENAVIKSCAVFDKAMILNTSLNDSVIGAETRIDGAILGGNNVIGSKVEIKKNAHVLSGVKVYNNQLIDCKAVISEDAVQQIANKKEIFKNGYICGVWNHDITSHVFEGIAASFAEDKIAIGYNDDELAASVANLFASFCSLKGADVHIGTSKEASLRFYSCKNRVKAVYIQAQSEYVTVQLIDKKGLNISSRDETKINFDNRCSSLNRGKIFRATSLDKDFEFFLNSGFPFFRKNVELYCDEKYKLHNVLFNSNDYNGQIKKLVSASVVAQKGVIKDIYIDNKHISNVNFLRLKIQISKCIGAKAIFLPVFSGDDIVEEARNSGLEIYEINQHKGNSMQKADSFFDASVLLEFVPAYFSLALAYYLSLNEFTVDDKQIIVKHNFECPEGKMCDIIFTLNNAKDGRHIIYRHNRGSVTIVPQNSGISFTAYGKFFLEEYSPDIIEAVSNEI